MEWEPQHPNAPTGSSSLSSQSVSSTGTRSEKVPVLKQISPSAAVSALSKLTDDELRRKGVEDLVRILHRVEADYKSLLGEHGNIVKDVNRRLQIFVLETRSLKEVNQKLQEDNQELRDLCCFLDDDRQRGRKLAREWQRFGRYTASVMRSEVAVYQEKLRELEDKQNELITENMELKELCLFLDQERVRMTGDRDEGDGSSNGTVTGHEDGVVSTESVGSNLNTPVANNYPISPSSAASYIRELELKVRLLEDEKKVLAQRVDRNSADGFDINSSIFDNTLASQMPTTENDQLLHGLKSGTTLLRKSPVSSKPETVMHAMKVLQVHEELEKIPTEDEGLDDPEKAIVREMCNVVWRTLGDTEDIGSFNESSDSIQEPPYIADSSGKSNVPPPSTQPPYGQVHTYGYSSAQPHVQTGGAATSAGMKQSNVVHQSVLSTADNFSGPHQLQSQRHNSSRPSHESKQQQFSQSDSEMRGRENSLSEKISADRNRTFQQKQPIDRSDDRRYPEQKQFSNFMQDTSGNPSQQLSQHLPPQQPSLPSSHQQHSMPDMGGDLYSSQRSTDQTARSIHQSSHFQQPPPISAHQQQQSLLNTNMQSHPSQRNTNLTSRSVDLSQRFQQQPSSAQHPSSSVFVGNQSQRSVDLQSNKLQSGHIHPQSAASLVGQPFQNQRNTQSYPHQQVKLLDAPGTGRHVQRIAPTQVQAHNRDKLREESFSHGQTRLHSRGDNAYEERNSSERDNQPHHTQRSVSSSSVLNPPNPQNQQGMKSTQNYKGPSVFRAYPPQLTSVPTQSVVSLKGSQSQELSSSGNQNQHDPTRGNYPLSNQPPNKRFQEQEWRQTYLDDSDTL